MATRAELIWDGKYDAKGNRVAPLRVALPFQTVETINESAQERARNLFQRLEQEQPWRNRLIWGDKKYVLPSLLPEFAGKVNLIYIDPPFDTGADFSFTATVPDSNPDDDEDDSASFTKEPSLIEQKAYRDTWGRGLDSYLQWFYETVVVLHELLAETGSMYVHLDWHFVHYAKCVIDEVFGPSAFMSEVVWKRTIGSTSIADRYRTQTDSILVYTKTEAYVFHEQFTKAHLTAEEIAEKFPLVDPVRGPYCTDNLANPDYRPTLMYEYKGYKPPAKGWAISREKMKQWDAEGRLHFPKDKSKRIRRKRFLSEWPGAPVQNLWDDVAPLQSQSNERTGYATQKPKALLDRVVEVSSNEGDLVLDCFVGSGTTAAVAEKLNRRWIACDLGRFAIHTTRKRLLQIEGVRPFIVQNLGKYERQLWVTNVAEFARIPPDSGEERNSGEFRYEEEQADERHRAYIEFILKLYGATPIGGRTWLHGVRGGRMAHVGGVEAPVSLGDVKQIVAEFKKAMGTGKDAPSTNGIDVLGWDFAFEINEVARQQAADANIKMAFKRIPRDVMDKRAVDQGEIKFFELAALGVDVKTNGNRKNPGGNREITLKLSDFVIPPDDVPEDVRGAVKHWSQWIDYWSVDWDNKSDTFHNQWQAFRTRKDNKLPLEVTHEYPEAGGYRVVVKVIDILGNDTTKTVKVQVK